MLFSNWERVPGQRNVDRHVLAKLGAQDGVGSGAGCNLCLVNASGLHNVEVIEVFDAMPCHGRTS